MINFSTNQRLRLNQSETSAENLRTAHLLLLQFNSLKYFGNKSILLDGFQPSAIGTKITTFAVSLTNAGLCYTIIVFHNPETTITVTLIGTDSVAAIVATSIVGEAFVNVYS